MEVHNEQQQPSIPETPIPTPEVDNELRVSYLGLTLGIATVAITLGVYAKIWKERWNAADKAVKEAERERDNISRDTKEGKDKWWAADQKMQEKIIDKYDIEDEHPGESPA